MVIREHIFTDGSCLNNGQLNSRGGYAIFFHDDDSRNMSSCQKPPCSNQKGELLAIHAAFEKASKKPKIHLIICTDSSYCINIFTKWIMQWEKNSWKKKNNQEICHLDIIRNTYDNIIYRKKEFKQNITFQHINSHQKAPRNKESYAYFLWYGNKRADELARRCNIKNIV